MSHHFTARSLCVAASLAACIAAGTVHAAAPSATFAALDTNKDGKISLHEASSNDDLFVAFKQLDTNRDGDLTPTEFAAYSPK